MYQREFTQIYNRLLRYAYYKAGRYFLDVVLRQDAADEAVNKAVDNWVAGKPIDEKEARKTIDSFLRQCSRKRRLEPISSEDSPPEVAGGNIRGYRILE